MRRIVLHMVILALRMIWENEIKTNPKIIYALDENQLPVSMFINFINLMLRIGSNLETTTSIKDYTEFFQVFYKVI